MTVLLWNTVFQGLQTFLVIILLLTIVGCTPIPLLNEIKIENQSNETIFVYTQDSSFRGVIVQPAENRYLQIDEDNYFFIYLTDSKHTMYYKFRDMGYSVGHCFFAHSGRYQPLVWTSQNQLFVIEQRWKYTELVSPESQHLVPSCCVESDSDGKL